MLVLHNRTSVEVCLTLASFAAQLKMVWLFLNSHNKNGCVRSQPICCVVFTLLFGFANLSWKEALCTIPKGSSGKG